MIHSQDKQPLPDAVARLARGFTLACRFHADQKRKGTAIPYISHLMGTAAIVMEHGGSEDEVLAALLHDAIEDAGGPKAREIISHELGEGVAKIVDGCSDTDQAEKPAWRLRKEAYIAHLRNEPEASIRLVSAADKLHNARAILADYRKHGEALWGRFKGGRDGTLWYYESMVKVFRETGTAPALVDELDRVVASLKTEIERTPTK